ncbi:hypothetical protein HDF14_000526 [Edaphobacter lichenicola]|jgi:hypothetical protein|uniref:Uncharacterized protein n=1 Tax=Tunturiibacter gelidiferens TaxID=3069689 RepID=A0A9X0U3M0_9BACT|nr:hypothetical protein [Edaphobacter lichenicola]
MNRFVLLTSYFSCVKRYAELLVIFQLETDTPTIENELILLDMDIFELEAAESKRDNTGFLPESPDGVEV